MKGLEPLLTCENCKAKIYGVYNVVAGMKVCYRCDPEVNKATSDKR